MVPHQLARAVQVEGRAVEAVGARLGHCVDDAAGRASELWRVTGGHDLELADRLLWNGRSEVRALAAADTAKERLVVVSAVHVDVGVNAALAGQRDLATLRVDLRGRRQCDEILEAAAINREVLNGIQVNQRVGLRGGGLHAAGRYGDRLLHVSDAHRNVYVGNLSYSDQNIFDFRLGEAAGFSRQLVNAWRKQYETIKAIFAGGGAALETCLSADRFNGGFRNCATIIVTHRTTNLPAICLRLRECVTRAEDEREREQQATAE